MPANYVLLEKITVGAAGASSVTFSGIPQTGYTDLCLKLSLRDNRASTADFILISFNGSTTTFTNKYLEGDGFNTPASGSTARATGLANAATSTASTFSNTEIYIPNYASSNYKSYSADSVSENNATTAFADLHAGLWSNTAAITSIGIAPNSGTSFDQYSTFYLYGVAKLGTTPAIVPYATGGDTIMTDGTYWYHTFVSSGTFTPAKAISCDYLVVAGGGSGGGSVISGGGGAGGLRSTVTATGGGGSLESALSLTSGTNYTVTIGAGGAGTGHLVSGNPGSNSVFSTITSTGGGRGSSYNSNNPGTGGSGGGANGDDFTSYTGGAGTANQGYAGGNGQGGTPFKGGGGGGAGAVGSNGSATGNGGNGVAVSISGSSVTYAGGGGRGWTSQSASSGTGGTGGGGTGGTTSAIGQSGTANTGSGGGGGGDNGFGFAQSGAGGSGIVIVRYAV